MAVFEKDTQSGLMYFTLEHLKLLDEVVVVSEDLVSDYFSLSSRHWLKNPYEIRTLAQLENWENPGKAYAHLVRYCRPFGAKQTGADSLAFYRICLHDHNILVKTQKGKRCLLYPFLIYVLTHELVHIVRFGMYQSHPLAPNREEEEEKVYELTWDILNPVCINGMSQVLEDSRNIASC